MKKLLVLILAIALLASMALSLASCKKDDGIPEGMQLVRGGENLGYYFYAPEEWTVANDGDIACVYTSAVNTASVTFVEGDVPTDADLDTAESAAKNEIGTNIDEYFEREMASFPFPIEVKTACQPVNFGNAEQAYKYVYTYKYGQEDKSAISMSCMQIFVKTGGRFFIFTYSANNYEHSDGKTYYQFYLEEKVPSVIDNFKFCERVGDTSGDTPEYERDSDGFILVSDKKLAKVDLYLPDSFKVISSGASVTAVSGDISVNLSPITEVTTDSNGVYAYWEARRSDLAFISGNTLTVAKNEDGTERVNMSTTVSGARWAFAYEYTYTLAGETYSVYQVYSATATNAFTVTYTVRANAIGAEQMAEAQKIIAKLEA